MLLMRMFWLRFVWLVIVLATPLAPRAEVTLDGSFGTDGPVPSGTGPDGVFTDHLIEERFGRVAGSNLFHSFGDFSIPGGQSATFTAISPIQRVIGRVTGGNTSIIQGALRSTIDGADIFVANPSGWIIGPNAVMDVLGAVHLTTAPTLVFPDAIWPTDRAESDSILSTAPPGAFGFLDAPPAAIRFEGSQLELPEGTTFSAVGGSVALEGRIAETVPVLRVPGGRIQLASANSAIDMPVDLTQLDMAGREAGELGEITFSENVVLDVNEGSAHGAGSIVIRGGRFMMDGGQLNALTGAFDGAETAVDIAAAESIAIGGRALVQAGSSGSGNGGAIRLAGGDVSIADTETLVGVLNVGSGTGGDMHVTGTHIDLAEGSGLISRTASPTAAGGSIYIEGDYVTVRDDARVSAESFAAGDGGSVDVQAELVNVRTGGGIGSSSQAAGRGGDVTIEAGTIELSDGGSIASDARSSGGGGNVDIIADSLTLTGGSQITTQVLQGASGSGGNLNVQAGTIFASTGQGAATVTQIGALTLARLGNPNQGVGGELTVEATSIELRDGGQMRTTTEGDAAGGEARITVEETLLITGQGSTADEGDLVPSGIFARSPDGATGPGGNAMINAKNITVENGGEVSSRTFGAGSAGNLSITVAEQLRVGGGPLGPSTISARGRIGQGGELSISADQIELADGGSISASTASTGSSGNVEVEARDILIAGSGESGINRSGIFAQTNANNGGNAGSITIHLGDTLIVSEGGLVSVASRGDGDAGSVTIQGGQLVEVSSGAEVSARALDDGDAGSVNIEEVQQVHVFDSGTVTAQSGADGQSGSVTIEAAHVSVENGGEISAKALGSGDGGSVNVETQQLNVSGGTLTTEATEGQGGSISIMATDRVDLSGGAEISARSTGPGDAGNIVIDAGSAFVATDSQVSTQATQAFGGNISIAADERVELVRSSVLTDVQVGVGNGGNIDIDPRFVIINNSQIIANAFAGNGGNITITGDEVLISTGSVISASSELGISGTIRISSPDADLSTELAELPTSFLDVSSLLQNTCSARQARAGSLVVRGRDRVPRSPDAPLRSFYAGSSGGTGPQAALPKTVCVQ